MGEAGVALTRTWLGRSRRALFQTTVLSNPVRAEHHDWSPS
jgi:hypothetical protein